ncbi:MAG: M23 family metallopeptidase [Erysipelotrichaceae bacterium]|nr:M23 family metallopeptidase [Erysipelotrichaceae bacterium]
MNKKYKLNKWPLEAKAGLLLTLSAALIVGGTLLFRDNGPSSENPISSDTNVNVNDPSSPTIDDPVTETIEVLVKPFTVEVDIAHYFYDMSDDLETRTKAIVQVPNKESTYMKSVGVDYCYNNQFDVVASCSGVVVERTTDSIYGNLLCIEHESGLKTIYSSLNSFNVSKGDKVEQGDVIGKSGESLFTTGLGSSLHFELIKDGKYLNPEKSYTLEITKI